VPLSNVDPFAFAALEWVRLAADVAFTAKDGTP
jgi:hypothetical protein